MRAGVRSFLKPWRIGDGWKSNTSSSSSRSSMTFSMRSKLLLSLSFGTQKPGLFDEIEWHRTAHNDVAAVCDPSSLSDEVCRGDMEHGQWHSPMSSSGNPVLCSGVPRVPWSKDAVVAVKSSVFMP